MIYLKTFKLSDSRIENNNIYPFSVISRIPENSRYIKSEEILYEIRK